MSRKPKEEPAAPPEALHEMIERAQLLARARAQLADMVGALQRGIDALKADKLPSIAVAIDAATEAWKGLEEQLRAHPELFVRPRSIEAHGIKFGYAKGKGSLQIADPDKTMRLIRKLLPDQVELLIQTEEKPRKEALAALPAEMLKKLAVELGATGDVPFIKPADGAVDKLVKALVEAKVGGEA